MEETGQKGLDRFSSVSSPGERAVELHNLAEPVMSFSPNDQRSTSANPSPDAVVAGAPGNVKDQSATSQTSGTLSALYQPNAYAPQEHGFYFGGYENGPGNWDEQSNYINANSLHVVPPAMYNDSQSVFFPPSFGFDAHMAYGQFSPIANPLSPVMIDSQLYSSHQIPVSPSYYPPPVSPGLPHVSSALQVSQTEMMVPGSSAQENLIENMLFGPGPGYYVPFGSFGGLELSGTNNSNVGFYNFQGEFGPGEPLAKHTSPLDSSSYLSPLTTAGVYPQPLGILGSYEQNVQQGLGFASSSSASHFPPGPHGGSYQTAIYGGASNAYWESSRNRVTPDRSVRRERDQNSFSINNDSLGMSSDRNRGPRASKPRGKISPEQSSSVSIPRDVESTSGLNLGQYNSRDFVTDYEMAKFFVIKSFSEDNVHKSIKYNVWASTPLGNKKLDAAFKEANEMEGSCPVFLFFSVNASGQFCGVAEMIGPVDFENDAEYWQQDRWSGQFPVKWHIIKDVPNSHFRHILLDNNENKPVTHSRDSQQVKLEQGIEILKIFKNFEAETSLIDDFTYYDDREKLFLERRAKNRASSSGNSAVTVAADSIDKLADNMVASLKLEGQ